MPVSIVTSTSVTFREVRFIDYHQALCWVDDIIRKLHVRRRDDVVCNAKLRDCLPLSRVPIHFKCIVWEAGPNLLDQLLNLHVGYNPQCAPCKKEM